MLLPLVRSLVLASAVMSLAGCYDLSDPSGPSKADFARDTSSDGEPDPVTNAEPCTGEACIDAPAQSALTLRHAADALDADAGTPKVTIALQGD